VKVVVVYQRMLPYHQARFAALDVAAAQQVVAWDWRQKLGWPSDCVVVGFTGRLEVIKGVDILFQALVQLQGEFPELRVVVVGDGAERASLQAFVASQGLGERVHFAGRLAREEVLGAIKGFDLAAVPSREEGFGLSALEAMALGVPVIASRVHALEEVVLDGKTGLLFAAGSPAALAECLVSIMRLSFSRMGWLNKLGQQAADHAHTHYDVENYRTNLRLLLESMDEN
jgi:glycosyltransferase involved in cell wall biosynthesis